MSDKLQFVGKIRQAKACRTSNCITTDIADTIGFRSERLIAKILILIPDRLPSLIVLVGFWIPPAVAGLLAAEFVQRSSQRARAVVTYLVLAIFVLGYAAAWFYFNLGRMPPYIPGATTDPTFASPRAVANLAIFTGALVLPGSALACLLAFRVGRALRRTLPQ